MITDRMDEYDEAVNQYKLLQRTDQKVDIFAGYFYNFKATDTLFNKSFALMNKNNMNTSNQSSNSFKSI